MTSSPPPPQGPPTEVAALSAADPVPAELRARVLALLAAGEVVALPTETVYGLAVRADRPEALERLRALKGRDGGKPFTWVADRERLLAGRPPLAPLLSRLTERYWPGPLTLVQRGVPTDVEALAAAGWLGARHPAHPQTAQLLLDAEFPVALTSANPSGKPPAVDAAQVLGAFSDQISLLIDGGSTRMGEPSAVLAVGPGRFELLREGLLPRSDLVRTAGLRIGFCCTGNTCRSPMAEGLARHLLAQRLAADPASPVDPSTFGFEVRSFGIVAGSGSPAAEHAVRVLADRGIDLRGHASRPATPEALAELDLVLGLTEGHVHALRRLLPPARSRAVQLLDPEGRDVPDPIGGSQSDYARCAEVIEAALRIRLDDWA